MSKLSSPSTITPRPKAKYGWILFAISILFVFYKYILEVSPSVITSQLISEFKINTTMIGHVAASYYYAYTIMQIPGGLLIDTFGTRRVTTIGILCCSLGALLFSFSGNILLLLISRFTIGLGATFAILNVFKIASNWFPSTQFALLSGLNLTFGILGAVLGQAPLSLLTNYIGWRQSFTDFAIFGIIFSAIFYFMIRDKPPHLSYDVTPPTRGKVQLSTALFHIIRNKQTWFLSIYSGLAFTPILSFAGLWGVSFIETKYHFERAEASFLTSLVFIGFAIGAPLFGWYSSYIGKRKPVMFWGTSMALACLTLALYLPPIPWSLYATLLFLTGFSISSFLLSFTIIHEINIPLMTASAIGIMNTANALFGALTDPLIGFFLSIETGSPVKDSLPAFSLKDFHLAFSILPIYFIICLILLIFIRETHCKQTLEDKG